MWIANCKFWHASFHHYLGKLVLMIFYLPTLNHSRHNIMHSLKSSRMPLKSLAICPPWIPPTSPSFLHSEYLFRSSNSGAPLTHLGSILLGQAVNTWTLSLVSLIFFMANYQIIFTSMIHSKDAGLRTLLLIFFPGGEENFVLFLISLKPLSLTPSLLEHLQSLSK